MSEKAKVLVKEKIADAGVELLRERFDVELGLDWDGAELEQRIGEFDGILIRSATKLTPDLIDRAERLKVIGRAGTGVDNVDVEAATKRGIVVANAPEANSIAAAEHTMAPDARPLPEHPAGPRLARRRRLGPGQASRAPSSTARRSECSASGGSGSSSTARAQAFDMPVIAYDKFVTAERFRELGVDGVDDPDELYARADFITLHLPNTPETVNFIDAEPRSRRCARGSGSSTAPAGS